MLWRAARRASPERARRRGSGNGAWFLQWWNTGTAGSRAMLGRRGHGPCWVRPQPRNDHATIALSGAARLGSRVDVVLRQALIDILIPLAAVERFPTARAYVTERRATGMSLSGRTGRWAG